MTRAELLRAIEKPILSFFPYEMANANFDEASEKIGYRYNK